MEMIRLVLLFSSLLGAEQFTLKTQCIFFEKVGMAIERAIVGGEKVMRLEATYEVWMIVLHRNWLQAHDPVMDRMSEPDMNLDGIINLADFNSLIKGMVEAKK